MGHSATRHIGQPQAQTRSLGQEGAVLPPDVACRGAVLCGLHADEKGDQLTCVKVPALPVLGMGASAAPTASSQPEKKKHDAAAAQQSPEGQSWVIDVAPVG